MPGDVPGDDLDFGQTVQIPRFGSGQKIFRRYVLQKILGRGGMGVVWLARDEDLETLIALKVLPETLCHDRASLEALKRETKLGLHLAHPNIVRIYNFERDDDAAAISMEYVDGPTFSDLRITKPAQVFEPQDLQVYLEDLCDALHYAHSRERIVHRDLKPRNLMLNSHGELKIADFGISRSISDSMILATGMLGSAGSPPYISPQQWDGEPPSPLDDIYSVGATLYELLSSKPPFIGVVDWHQVHEKIAPPICKRRAELGIEGAPPIPAEWEQTIAACLAKNPKDRPQTVREVQNRLTISGQAAAAIARSNSPAVGITAHGVTETAESSKEDFFAEATLKDIPEVIVDTATAQVEPNLDATAAPIQAPSPSVSKAILNKAGDAIPEDVITSPDQPQVVTPKSRKVARWIWTAATAAILILAATLTWRKPAPSKPPPPSLADLLIESEPSGADLTVDGAAPIKTPNTLKDLKFGQHHLGLMLEGYSPVERDIEFNGSRLPKIVLEPKPIEEIATLSVRTDPPGASILLDGVPPSESNTFTKVKFGEHRLTATLEGFEPTEQTLVVTGDTDLVLKLEKQAPSHDPVESLVEERARAAASGDWARHHAASLQLLARLTGEGEPVSNEHRQILGTVLDDLRTRETTLTTEEFHAHEENIRKAALLDILPAILILADKLKATNSPEAFNWYYYAAETKHNVYAMTKIAWLYWLGESGQQANRAEGFNWFKHAYEAGDLDAGTMVGDCYLRGAGIPKNEAAGIHVLLALAKLGVAHAKTLIGQCYYNGWGQFVNVPKQERNRMAKVFFEDAIHSGDWPACGHLGMMYETGQGVPKDWKQAARFYLQGVEHEDPVCMYYYARALESHGAELTKMFGRQEKPETYYIKAAAASMTEARRWCIEHNVQF